MNRGNRLPAFAFRQAVMVPNLEQRTSQHTRSATIWQKGSVTIRSWSKSHTSTALKHTLTTSMILQPTLLSNLLCIDHQAEHVRVKLKANNCFTSWSITAHHLSLPDTVNQKVEPPKRLHGDHQILTDPQEGQRTRTHSRVILITFVSSMISSSPRDSLGTPQSPPHFGATHKNLADQCSSWAAQTAQCQR